MNQNQSISIAYIQAGWHEDIVERSFHGFAASLGQAGIATSQIERFAVPGSLEIPLQAQRLARSGHYDVIVCAGLIVNGGIYRHEFVAQTVLDGMMRVQLDADVPVLSVVLTPHEFQDTAEHRQFFSSHFEKKGAEAAAACLAVIRNQQERLTDTGTARVA